MTVPIEVDTSGRTAPPRLNGELQFEAPWQGRAFGLCLALLERNGDGWDAFRTHLVAHLEAAPDRAYYDSFVLALEAYAGAAARAEGERAARAAQTSRP